jgi:imidazolonepropionase-like amidohydrolase
MIVRARQVEERSLYVNSINTACYRKQIMKLFFFALIVVFLLIAGACAQKLPVTVISGATLIDGSGAPPVPGAVVILKGDKIAAVGTSSSVAIPPSAHIIDARGKFLLPGLIDTHVHLEMTGLSDIGDLPSGWDTPEKLRDLIILNAKLDFIAGFTTVRDLGSTSAVMKVRDDIDSGKFPGPRIVAAGMQLVKKTEDAWQTDSFLEYDGRDSAQAKVRYLASIGAGVIKIRLTRSRTIPSVDEVRAIVEEAHRLGLKATVHTDVPADDLVKLAIDAGADGIEHNAPLRSQDDTVLSRMARKRMSLMAGAGAFYVQRIDSTGLIDRFDAAQDLLLPADIRAALHAGIDSLHRQTDKMKEGGWNAVERQTGFIRQIQQARSAGVLLVFGTDCGAYGIMHGEQYKALYGESRMGSSAAEAILMATGAAAAAIGKGDELGTVQAGKNADLVLVNADPLADLRNLHQIFRVIKGGIVYDPAELIASAQRGNH